MESQAKPAPSGPEPEPGASMRIRLRKRARAITLVYACFAAAWIYTSLLLLVVVSRAFKAIAEGYLAIKQREREGKAAQLEAERVGRLYAALGAVNQAIVRTGEGSALLQPSWSRTPKPRSVR